MGRLYAVMAAGMQAMTALIVLAVLANDPCGADMTVNAVQDDGPTNAQQRVRAEQLDTENLSNLADKSAAIDADKAITTAAVKENEHKARTPKQRAEHAKKTPLSQDIATSHARERALKAEKIAREERQAKELTAKKERDAKRVAAARKAEREMKEKEEASQSHREAEQSRSQKSKITERQERCA